MNGKKILVNLIWVFLSLNIILFIINSATSLTKYKVSQARLTQIENILAHKDITLNTKLPNDFEPKLPATLNFEKDNSLVSTSLVKAFFGEDISSVLRSSEERDGMKVSSYIKASEILSFEKSQLTYNNLKIETTGDRPSLDWAKIKGQAFIERLGKKEQFKNTYVEAYEEPHCWRLKFFPCFDDIPLFDLYAEVEVYEAGTKNATLFLGEVETVNEGKQEIYPIDRILFGIEEYIPLDKNIVIQDVRLGYKRVEKKSNTIWGEQIVPAYKIEVKGLDEALFVNAYTSEIMK